MPSSKEFIAGLARDIENIDDMCQKSTMHINDIDSDTIDRTNKKNLLNQQLKVLQQNAKWTRQFLKRIAITEASK